MSKNGKNRKKSVLIIISQSINYGGGERFAMNLAKEISSDYGYYPILCTLKDVGKEGGNEPGFPIIALKNKRTIILFNFISMIKIIVKYKISVIHAHGVMAAFYSFLPGIFAGIKKRVWHFHSIPDEYFNIMRRFLLMKILFWMSTDIIACSNIVADKLIELFNVSRSKIKVIYNGIPYNKKGNYVDNPYKNLSFNPCLGMVARMDGKKGHNDMLEALKYIRKKYPKTGIIFVGDGEYRSQLENKIRSEGLGNAVHFAGWIKNDDIYNFYSLFDIFVLPSLMEAVPISIMEAMCCGVPVVTTSVGGIKEIIEDQKEGILVEPQKPSQIASAIIKMLDDKSLYNSIKSNAVKKSQMFKIDRTLKELKKVYC